MADDDNKEPEIDTDPGDDRVVDFGIARSKRADETDAKIHYPDDLSAEALADENIVIYEDNPEATAFDCKKIVDKLKARIKELEKKNAELLDGWQRDKADFLNARKRDEEQKMEFLKFSKADIIAELLAVLDSFESAFKNKEAWEKADKNWRMGVEYIHTQLMNIMTQNGLKVINPLGEKYDLNRDEAVETVKVDDEKDNDEILEVIRVGYEMHGKEIRAPKVRVGKFE